jgi:hypothetical protein
MSLVLHPAGSRLGLLLSGLAATLSPRKDSGNSRPFGPLCPPPVVEIHCDGHLSGRECAVRVRMATHGKCLLHKEVTTVEEHPGCCLRSLRFLPDGQPAFILLVSGMLLLFSSVVSFSISVIPFLPSFCLLVFPFPFHNIARRARRVGGVIDP